MFSRLSLQASKGLERSLLIKFQPSLAFASNASKGQPQDSPLPKNKKAVDQSKVDFANFPKLVRPEYSPPVRMGFIPDSWFQFFYPKTGVTGPYMFGFGALIYLFSKEIIVMDHNFIDALAFIIFVTVIHQKFGGTIAEFYNKDVENEINELRNLQKEEKARIANIIKSQEELLMDENVLKTIMDAKKENIALQLEAIYRSRLSEIHSKVKKHLDCQVELHNTERKIVQRNLADYVIRNVMKSINADQENLAMQNCISQLNALAAKA